MRPPCERAAQEVGRYVIVPLLPESERDDVCRSSFCGLPLLSLRPDDKATHPFDDALHLPPNVHHVRLSRELAQSRPLRSKETAKSLISVSPANRSTAAPQTIPPPQADGPSGAASKSSGDSTSPNLSSSPLDSFSGIQQALPSPATGGRWAPNGYTRTTSGRENSYESSVDALAGGEDVHEHDDTDDALRRYRRACYPPLSSSDAS